MVGRRLFLGLLSIFPFFKPKPKDELELPNGWVVERINYPPMFVDCVFYYQKKDVDELANHETILIKNCSVEFIRENKS